jgi:Reeler domain./FG-GAP repeat.
VQITGIPANYLPGQQIPVTVTVNQSDAVLYGFQFTAIDSAGARVGTYTLPTVTPQTLQVDTGIINGLERRYVSHNANGTSSTVFGTKSWNFTWTAPAQRAGKVSFYAAGNAANSDGGTSGDQIYTAAKATLSGSGIASFDADGISDVSVFRPSGIWYSLNSSNGDFNAVQFGLDGDIATPGDYDGDGKTDRAVFRPSTGVWYIAKSGGGIDIVGWGLNGDIPVPGDYDGDLKNDIAVWRPSTGVWYILKSSNGGFDFRAFGLPTDKTAQADFDGDGKTDVAVWRPTEGLWYIWRSGNGAISFIGFGLAGDRPVQSDYDGDGRADVAVFRPSNGVWYLLRSSQGFTSLEFGIASDRPAPADFDGDGKTDIAVYRNGLWYILNSATGAVNIVGFGLAGDVPIPAAYLAP